jgi:2,4-dienoyl-CoA reductase-like NADH-dependent reductase (Old Yellow Enzyme family)
MAAPRVDAGRAGRRAERTASVTYEAILAPIRLGDVEVPNRVVRASHLTQYTRRGEVTDQFVAYHEARARGGVGLTILESASVDRAVSPAPLDATTDGVIDGWGRVADAVHRHGMRVFAQLFHGGNQFDPRDGSAPWSASTVPGWVLGVPAQAMTTGMIDHVVESFAAAARRAEASGLDGAELHGAHGYLIAQFLSPLTNRRTDEYGGSLENRLRFPLEVLRAVRSTVGVGFPVGIRLAGNEQLAGGLDNDDCIAIAQAIATEELVDFIDLSAGLYQSMNKMVGPMNEPRGYELPDSVAVARAVATPCIVTGRILTLAEADAIVTRGDAAMVSMVRATIADPDLVRRSVAGQAPRPCIGCLHGCFGGLYVNQLGCTVNATVGREAALVDDPETAVASRRVLVVGGGPAGLEAARMAATRGHAVVLFDRQDRLGGQLALARLTPDRGDIGLIVDWQADELRRLGVDICVRRDVSAESLADLGRFDVAIVATGPSPRPPLQLARPALTLTPTASTPLLSSWELLGDTVQVPPGPVVLLDDIGHMEAMSVAQSLVARGCTVTVVTRFSELASQIQPAWATWSGKEYLARAGVELRGRSFLADIGDGSVTVSPIDGGADMELPAVAVVHVTYHEPNLDLADRLSSIADEVRVIGEARTQRFLTAAVHDGYEAGRSV